MIAFAPDAVALAGDVRSGQLRASDAVDRSLAAADQRSELGAFWSLASERALTRARALDRGAPLTAAEWPLAGVPLAVKDDFDLAGLPTTGGLRGVHRPARSDAVAVRQLERAGAIAIGKTAMDALAWSTHGQAEGFPPCRNPLDPVLSPGGSSAGSAVAVAAGIAPIGLGTDTAGSARVPAAYCGIVGCKPALGAVALDGCLPLAPSFDTAGVLATSVRDCAAALQALTGERLAPAAVPDPAAVAGPVGVLTDLFEGAEPAVAAVCDRGLRRLESAGVQLEPVELGWWAPDYGLLLAVEFAAAWRARAQAGPERFPPAILSAIERATEIPAARRGRVTTELAAAREALAGRLGSYSAVLSPTVPIAVPTVDAEEVATSTRFTRIFSALGWPALSLPCGADDHGRPVGLHVSSAGALAHVVRVAALVEQTREL